MLEKKIHIILIDIIQVVEYIVGRYTHSAHFLGLLYDGKCKSISWLIK